MGPNVAVLHVDDYNIASGLPIYFFSFKYLLALHIALVWLENCLFFDVLVKQRCFY
jgi:hypothetical protein